MSKKILIVLKWMHCFLLVGSLVGIYEFMMPSGNGTGYYRILFLLLPIIASYMCIHYKEKLMLYCLTSVILSALAFLFGNTILERVIFVSLTIVICISRLSHKVKKELDISWLDIPNIGFLIFFLLIYVLGTYFDVTNVKVMIYYHAGAYMLIYLAFTSLANTDKYLEDNRVIKNIPVSAIKSLNSIYLSILLALSTAAIVIVPAGSFDRVFTVIKNILFKIGRFIVQMLFFWTGDEVQEEAIVEETLAQQDVISLLEQEVNETPKWMEILEKVVATFTLLLIVAGIAAVIFFTLRAIYKKFYSNKRQMYNREEQILSIDKQERIKSPKSQVREGLKLNFTPEAAIRKRYKKIIETASKNPPSSSDTPMELEHNAGLVKSDGREVLHTYYEKARYSDQDCTKEEARLVKEVARKNIL